MIPWMAGLMLPALAAPPEAPSAADAIYFVMVDRFADGVPNDAPTDRNDPQAWHGGDLRGVLQHVDHLADLGIRTVWLSPIWRSRQDPFGEWGAYHGYWVDHWDTMEPRFGTAEDLAALSDALHARGMRLVLDMVFNHVGFDSPIRTAHPDWFHDAGTVQDWSDPVQVVQGQIHGLPDLAQERSPVSDWLQEQAERWMRIARADGIRVDAVRHMPAAWLAGTEARLESALGPIETIGEIFDGNRRVLVDAWRQAALDAAFDYPVYYALTDSVCDDQHPGRLAAALTADAVDPPPGRWVVFVDNHDVPRITSRCHDDPGRVEQALALMLTARGTPAITWGTESGLKGAEEPDNRADMRFATQPNAALIRDLLALRRAHPVLVDGDTRALHLDADSVVFSRQLPHGKAALIAWNRGTESNTVRIPRHYRKMRQVWGDSQLRARAWTLPPGSVSVLTAHSRRQRTTVTVDLPLTTGEHAAGAGPLLGDWNPSSGPETPFEAPEGIVLAWKPVRYQGGEWRWPDGPNHYTLTK